MSAAQSGSFVAILTVFQALSALMIPVFASHNIDRRFWLIVTLSCQALGFSGLMLFASDAPLLWVALLGMGLGGCFALSIITALDHLPHPISAGALTSLMQAGGIHYCRFWATMCCVDTTIEPELYMGVGNACGLCISNIDSLFAFEP